MAKDKLEVNKQNIKDKATLEGYLLKGLTLKQMGDIEGVSSVAMSNRLSKHGLVPIKTQKAKERKDNKLNKNKPGSKQNGSNGSPDSQNRDNTSDKKKDKEDLDSVVIGEQFKELIAHITYAQDHGVENVNLGQMTTLYEKTKQLEKQEKEFEEDQKFLEQVEILCRDLKIDNLQVDLIPPLE